MKKLVAAFETNPTLETARKVINYINKHPMATVSLTKDELYIVRKAQSKVWGADTVPFGRPSFDIAGM